MENLKNLEYEAFISHYYIDSNYSLLALCVCRLVQIQNISVDGGWNLSKSLQCRLVPGCERVKILQKMLFAQNSLL